MQQLVLFVWLVLTSLFAAIGGLFSHGILGFLTTLPCLWLWSIGTINNTEEYHSDRVPDWITWISDEPKSNPKFKWFYNPTFDRLFSCFVLIVFAVAGSLVAHFEISYLILLLITWVCGVAGIEYYFRTRYTMR